LDFSYTREQNDLRELAAKIFADLAPATQLPSFERGGDRFDPRLWQELARAQLLGVALPSEVGGAGLGAIELCLVLEEAGAVLAPVPLLATLAMSAAAIARFGSEQQQQRLLAPLVAGDTVLSAALIDEAARRPDQVLTTARRQGQGWCLDGIKAFVPSAKRAERILISAKTAEDAIVVLLLDPTAEGVSLQAQTTTTGEDEYRLILEAAPVDQADQLGSVANGRQILDYVIDHSLAGLCASELGLAQCALAMTAEYVSKRKQFGKPLAAFQAVAQRAANAHIDVEALRLATIQAVWRLAEGLPARRELEIAKFWAAEAGNRACYAAQHLHGGIGVDTEYPLHHYYLRSNHIALSLGGANTQLASLGRRLADPSHG